MEKKTKSGIGDYHHLYPCLNQPPRIHKETQDFVFSEIQFPQNLIGVKDVPQTSYHLLGILCDGYYNGIKFRQSGDKWKSLNMIPGQFRLAPAHQNAARWEWDPSKIKGANRHLTMHFSPIKMAKIAVEVFDIDEMNIEVFPQIGNEDPFIRQMFYELRKELSSGSEFSAMYEDAVFNMLCTHLLSRHCTFRRRVASYKCGLNAYQLKLVVDYMETNFNQDIRLETLAQFCNMSTFHFAQAFKKSTGCPPHKYIDNIRLKKAKVLLKFTHIGIAEISRSLGYSNPFSFSTLFREHTGVSPGGYRHSSR